MEKTVHFKFAYDLMFWFLGCLGCINVTKECY